VGPLTGYEPKFEPELYNGDKSIQHSHNCFAYAMNVRDKKRIASCREQDDCHFHVPGKTKGHPEFSGKLGKTCGDVIGRTMADVPDGYLVDFPTKCEPGFSKIGIVVDEENDLHYYRQDSNQWWSHKPGGREVTNKDAAGARIYRPDLASRYYPGEYPGDSGLNYDSFCSYMCVPRVKPEVLNKKNVAAANENPIQIAGGRQQGGRVIGKGMQGIAFSPPLKCDGNAPNVLKNTGRASPFTKTRKSYVSKITTEAVADTELAAAESLRKMVDPRGIFTAPALAKCKAAPDEQQTNTDYSGQLAEIQEKGYDTLVFSRYRGSSILNIFENAETLTQEQTENILVALANLLENVSRQVNAKAGLLHYDAHPGNIVYDWATREASLIDFGFARPLDAATAAELAAANFAVPATLDIQRIFNDSILQFFLFGGEPPSSYLLGKPHLKSWFDKAKLLRKKSETTQQEYMDMAQELKRYILVVDIHEATDSEASEAENGGKRPAARK
jgi:hypothetical protein